MTPEPEPAPAPAPEDLPDADVELVTEPEPEFLDPPRRGVSAALLAVLALAAAGVATAAYFGFFHDWDAEPPGAAILFHLSRPKPILPPDPREPDDSESFRQRQAGLVRLRTVLNAALADPAARGTELVKSQDNPLEWLEANLAVTFDGEYMRVALAGEPVEDAVIVLNAVAKAYLEAATEQETGSRRRRLEGLEIAHHELDQELDAFHNRLDQLAQALGVVDGASLPRQREAWLRRLHEIEDEIRRVRQERSFREAVADVELHPQAGRHLANREEALRDELIRTREQLDHLSKKSGEVKALRRTIDAKEALATELTRLIARGKIEIRAASRVTQMDEPYVIGPDTPRAGR